MKKIFEIEYDGIYSSINEIEPINSWTGNPIEIDNFYYFKTKAQAKKHLINDLKNRINQLKYSIEHIKKTY